MPRYYASDATDYLRHLRDAQRQGLVLLKGERTRDGLIEMTLCTPAERDAERAAYLEEQAPRRKVAS